jgi:hypothetical protein
MRLQIQPYPNQIGHHCGVAHNGFYPDLTDTSKKVILCSKKKLAISMDQEKSNASQFRAGINRA